METYFGSLIVLLFLRIPLIYTNITDSNVVTHEKHSTTLQISTPASSDSVTKKCDYPPCKNGVEHTMCLYPETMDKTAPKCSSVEAKFGVTDEHRKVILESHNLIRQKIARGKEKGQPGAADMMKLKWDMELENIAQRLVNNCEKSNYNDDECRNLKDGTEVGQNSIKVLDEGANATKLFLKIVIFWYKKVSEVTPETVRKYNVDPRVETYTQLVWAKTDRVGCGYVEQNKIDDDYQPVLMACNYAIAGNTPGQPVYLEGDYCTRCPEGTSCSFQYPGLCTSEVDDFGGILVSNKRNTFVALVIWKLAVGHVLIV
ncbi:venom allergen 5-like [Macrosteles quadrilineatus]|uniref:venom allergen 5-like n=1 Tax=Macrosteles quadrilineatus TaxID=74068 RepID=UPI0023E1684E|nr:venom allergen 5-like [Macrosteles quadrilineatus]